MPNSTKYFIINLIFISVITIVHAGSILCPGSDARDHSPIYQADPPEIIVETGP